MTVTLFSDKVLGLFSKNPILEGQPNIGGTFSDISMKKNLKHDKFFCQTHWFFFTLLFHNHCQAEHFKGLLWHQTMSGD
jgi:hypothetical protein